MRDEGSASGGGHKNTNNSQHGCLQDRMSPLTSITFAVLNILSLTNKLDDLYVAIGQSAEWAWSKLSTYLIVYGPMVSPSLILRVRYVSQPVFRSRSCVVVTRRTRNPTTGFDPGSHLTGQTNRPSLRGR